MLAFLLIGLLVVLATSIWAGWDAQRLGARRGLLKGFINLSPLQWAVACMGLWGLAFPLYLASRSRIRAAAAMDPSPNRRSPARFALALTATSLGVLLLIAAIIPGLPGPLVVRGADLLRNGKPDSAATCFRLALAINRPLHGDKHFYTNNNRSWLGEALTKLGQYDEAEHLLTTALPYIESSPRAQNFNILRARQRIDELHAAREKDLKLQALHHEPDHHESDHHESVRPVTPEPAPSGGH